MMISVFTAGNYGQLLTGIGQLGLNTGEWLVLAAGTAALWRAETCGESLEAWFGRREPAGRVAVICTLALLILVFGMYGIGFDVEAFIYSRF